MSTPGSCRYLLDACLLGTHHAHQGIALRFLVVQLLLRFVALHDVLDGFGLEERDHAGEPLAGRCSIGTVLAGLLHRSAVLTLALYGLGVAQGDPVLPDLEPTGDAIHAATDAHLNSLAHEVLRGLVELLADPDQT